MKVALDENIPPTLALGLDAIFKGSKDKPFTVCAAKAYSPGPRAPSDIPWVQAFAEDGGRVVVSGEKKMRSVPHYVKAFSEAGVVQYYMPPLWNHWGMCKRAGFILVWWERVMSHAEDARRGSAWIVPANWTMGEFRRVTTPRG